MFVRPNEAHTKLCFACTSNFRLDRGKGFLLSENKLNCLCASNKFGNHSREASAAILSGTRTYLIFVQTNAKSILTLEKNSFYEFIRVKVSQVENVHSRDKSISGKSSVKLRADFDVSRIQKKKQIYVLLMGNCISRRSAIMWAYFWLPWAERGYCIRFDAKALLAWCRWCAEKLNWVEKLIKFHQTPKFKLIYFVETLNWLNFFFRSLSGRNLLANKQCCGFFCATNLYVNLCFLWSVKRETPKVRCHFVQLRVDKFRTFRRLRALHLFRCGTEKMFSPRPLNESDFQLLLLCQSRDWNSWVVFAVATNRMTYVFVREPLNDFMPDYFIWKTLTNTSVKKNTEQTCRMSWSCKRRKFYDRVPFTCAQKHPLHSHMFIDRMLRRKSAIQSVVLVRENCDRLKTRTTLNHKSWVWMRASLSIREEMKMKSRVEREVRSK